MRFGSNLCGLASGRHENARRKGPARDKVGFGPPEVKSCLVHRFEVKAGTFLDA